MKTSAGQVELPRRTSSVAVSVHRTDSSARPARELAGATRRFGVVSAASCSRCFSTIGRVARRLQLLDLGDDGGELVLHGFSFFCSGAALPSRASSKSAASSARRPCATSSYTFIARHHMHSDLRGQRDALDDLGHELGLVVVLDDLLDHLGRDVVLVEVDGGFSGRLVSPSTFLAESQSGFAPSRMQTHSITFCTSGGGVLKA